MVFYFVTYGGYTCRSYLFKPYLTPQKEKEVRYNAVHVETRNVIERPFEILKRRLSVLSIPVRTKLANTKNIIGACTVLHNIAIMNRLPSGDEVEEVFEPPVVPQVIWEHNNHRGHTCSAGIVERFF